MEAALESVFTFLFKYPPRLFERGELVLAPVVPVWLIALAALGALALVVLAYRQLRGISGTDRVVLGTTRALALVIVLACLLRPTEVLSSAVAQMSSGCGPIFGTARNRSARSLSRFSRKTPNAVSADTGGTSGLSWSPTS